MGVSTVTLTASDDITMNPASTTFDVTVNQSTIGIESISDSEFRVYPNPSDGNVKLALSDAYQGELQIAVFDMQGKKVYIGNHTVYNSTIKLDFTSLEKGMYILEFSSDDVVRKTRLIIE